MEFRSLAGVGEERTFCDEKLDSSQECVEGGEMSAGSACQLVRQRVREDLDISSNSEAEVSSSDSFVEGNEQGQAKRGREGKCSLAFLHGPLCAGFTAVVQTHPHSGPVGRCHRPNSKSGEQTQQSPQPRAGEPSSWMVVFFSKLLPRGAGTSPNRRIKAHPSSLSRFVGLGRADPHDSHLTSLSSHRPPATS